jgi:hypothetical protein
MKPLNISHALKTFSHPWVQQLPLRCKRDHCSWQFLEHCLCLLFQSLYSLCDDEVTFQMCWVYSSRSFMCECDVRITRPCPQQAEVRDSSNWRRTSSSLQSFLDYAKHCVRLKIVLNRKLCLLKKMSNNNDGDEETPQPETLSQLLITCQMTFDSLILLPSPLKVLKCSCATIEVFYEFSCVFRGVVPLSLDEIVGFSANHPFF